MAAAKKPVTKKPATKAKAAPASATKTKVVAPVNNGYKLQLDPKESKKFTALEIIGIETAMNEYLNYKDQNFFEEIIRARENEVSKLKHDMNKIGRFFLSGVDKNIREIIAQKRKVEQKILDELLKVQNPNKNPKK